MQILSKKDLSSDEMETLRISKNPTTVVLTNGEVQRSEEAQVFVHDLDLFGLHFYHLENFAKETDIPTSGPQETVRVSRNPTTFKKASRQATVYVYNLELFLIVQIFEDTPENLSFSKLCEDHGFSCEWINGESLESPLNDPLEWLEEFTEQFVDEEVFLVNFLINNLRIG